MFGSGKGVLRIPLRVLGSAMGLFITAEANLPLCLIKGWRHRMKVVGGRDCTAFVAKVVDAYTEPEASEKVGI